MRQMAPIEPDVSNSNFWPLSLFGSYLGLASGLVVFLVYGVLWREYRSLPPSQATRLRSGNRRRHVWLFAFLALMSIGPTTYYIVSYLALSYRVWANEVGEEIPQSLYGERGIFRDGTLALALGRWLHDTTLIQDAFEIMVERSRRFWWSQQGFLGAAAFSMLLGLEGRVNCSLAFLWHVFGSSIYIV